MFDYAIDAFIEGVKSDLRIDPNSFMDYEMEDYEEEFNNWVADKMDDARNV